MHSQIRMIKALGDETRLRILKLLLRQELCVCELEAALDLPQSKVSRHLTVLRSFGLVEDRREGLWIFYSLFKAEDDFGRSIAQLIKDTKLDQDMIREDKKRLERKLSQTYGYKCR